mgnify:CR=1 FL=1
MRGVGSRMVNAIGRHLPNGWRDFWLQFAIFWSFYVAYEGSRTLASPDRYDAVRNALDVVRAQQVLGLDRRSTRLNSSH